MDRVWEGCNVTQRIVWAREAKYNQSRIVRTRRISEHLWFYNCASHLEPILRGCAIIAHLESTEEITEILVPLEKRNTRNGPSSSDSSATNVSGNTMVITRDWDRSIIPHPRRSAFRSINEQFLHRQFRFRVIEEKSLANVAWFSCTPLDKLRNVIRLKITRYVGMIYGNIVGGLWSGVWLFNGDASGIKKLIPKLLETLLSVFPVMESFEVSALKGGLLWIIRNK